ncbi:MAG: hypothetical protein P8Q14_03560 [Vicingaceae bacterium]|nr:hypothetical protein [Vicingaceae bacterium]
MKMIRKVIFVIFGALTLMSSKCSQTKAIVQESPQFEIINAYIQKQVPGQQNQKSYMEFGFEVKGLKGQVVLDSVFCEVGKPIKINADGRSRISLLVEDELIDKLKYNKAVFHYTQKGNKYQFVLSNIKKKEPVFLP